MKIQVEVRTVSGENKIYPVCEKALMFAYIATTKTLTRQTIELIKKLGYEVEIVERSKLGV